MAAHSNQLRNHLSSQSSREHRCCRLFALGRRGAQTLVPESGVLASVLAIACALGACGGSESTSRPGASNTTLARGGMSGMKTASGAGTASSASSVARSSLGGATSQGAANSLGGTVDNQSSSGVLVAGGSRTTNGSVGSVGGTVSNSGASSIAVGTRSTASGGFANGGVTSTGGAVFLLGGAGASSVGGAAPVPAGAPNAGSRALGGMGGTNATLAVAGAPQSAGGPGTCAKLPSSAVAATDLVTFNDNGIWNWFHDERAVVDPVAQKLVIGSAATDGSRSGNVDAVIYDLATRTLGSPTAIGKLTLDEYNAPVFSILSPGKYLAVWAGHRTDCYTYFSTYDGSSWSAQQRFDWALQGCPWDGDSLHMITFSNLWAIGDNVLDFTRAAGTSPSALIYSKSLGNFEFYGRLTAPSSAAYVAGYYKYWGNNSDRIDFVATETHPRDSDNNLWHGYIRGDAIYDTSGNVVDPALKGGSDPGSAKDISAYSKVFATGTKLGGVELNHAWIHDIARYADGSVAILGQARVANTGTASPDLRLIYARHNGVAWQLTHLAKLGQKLIADEEDYTGLSALHPNDPSVIYVSTPIDPATGNSLKYHEIFKGVTCDQGATWNFAPVTSNSTINNLRPIVPAWDANHTALLWVKSSYVSAASIRASIVGIIMDGT